MLASFRAFTRTIRNRSVVANMTFAASSYRLSLDRYANKYFFYIESMCEQENKNR